MPAETTAPNVESDVTSALYRAAIGPIRTDHYLRLFTHFEAADRPGIHWNWAASLCTLNWMAFRRLWGAALAYMGGPRPIAYSPYGELTVFVFFGLVAVMGTDWVLTGDIGAATVVAAVALGALAAAALAVNNHRDLDHDAQAGRRTFAVTFGAATSGQMYALLLLGPFALTPVIAWLAASPMLLLPCLMLPAALTLWRDFLRCPAGLAFNQILFRTFKLELVFAVLLASGAVLDRLWQPV